MPILISISVFLNDLLVIFVGCFNSSNHLWAIGHRIVVLNFELGAHLFDHLIVEVRGIIWNGPFRQSISTNDLPFNELSDYGPCHTSIRGWFHKLCKIINYHENESMSIRSFWGNWSNHVHDPHWELPGYCYDMQLIRRDMNLFRIDLALMAFSHEWIQSFSNFNQ